MDRSLFRPVAMLSILLAALVNCSDSDVSAGRATAGIQLTRPVQFDLAGDSIDVRLSEPDVSSRGFWVAVQSGTRGGGIAIFDSSGALVNALSPYGSGPGEFMDVSRAGFGQGDTLFVLDQFIRLHVFSPPPEIQFLKTVRLGHLIFGDIMETGILTGAYVINGVLRSPSRFDWDGREIARFGTEKPQSESDSYMGPVFATDSTHIWAARGDEYLVELIDDSGTVSRRISRTVDWFPPGLNTTALPWIERPRPRITSVTVGSDGLLWVMVRRAIKDWTPTELGTSRGKGPVPVRSLPAVTDVNALFESVVEVFDTKTGQLVASTQLAGSMIGFASPDRICEVVELPTGQVTLRLWHIGLETL